MSISLLILFAEWSGLAFARTLSFLNQISQLLDLIRLLIDPRFQYIYLLPKSLTVPAFILGLFAHPHRMNDYYFWRYHSLPSLEAVSKYIH